jgi:hypothetical protein
VNLVELDLLRLQQRLDVGDPVEVRLEPGLNVGVERRLHFFQQTRRAVETPEQGAENGPLMLLREMDGVHAVGAHE